jgi:phosphoserine phosphatase
MVDTLMSLFSFDMDGTLTDRSPITCEFQAFYFPFLALLAQMLAENPIGPTRVGRSCSRI